MRDPTRGGLAATLNEIAGGQRWGIMLDEAAIPTDAAVKSACEILGLDHLYIANEGKVVLIVNSTKAKEILKKIRRHPQGKLAMIVGEVEKNHPGKVYLKTVSGGKRILDMPISDPLPRIC